MANMIGKISGGLLNDNLVREGVDLAFETDLLYLDVNNRRIGVRNDAPIRDFLIDNSISTANLIVDNVFTPANIYYTQTGITSTYGPINFVTPTQNQVSTSKLIVDNLLFNGNEIHSTDSSGNIILEASGTGTVEFLSDTTVHGNFHATGDITFDGNIIFGNETTDAVNFLADINSDIIPAVSSEYTLGSNDYRWNNFETVLVNGEHLESNTLALGNIDPVLRQGNSLFVAENGDDLNVGDHQNGPLATLSAALTDPRCVSGTTVYVYPGVYEEITPLTVPAGVTISGLSLRNCIIKPALSTIDNDIFLLNGNTIIENITVTDFEYNSSNNTGYAFKFSPTFSAQDKSAYIRNVSVLTKGSTVRLGTNPADDPLGFDASDAGRGAYLDGNVNISGTANHLGCLFSSVTFITPNADAMVITNGCRVETVNCFYYYPNRAVDIISNSDGIGGDGKTRLKIYGISSETVTAGNGIQMEILDNPGNYITATIESISYDSPYAEIIIDGLITGWETSLTPPDSQVQQNITFSPGGETATHIANVDYKDFGGELRSVNTAYVYGNHGIRAYGAGSLAYLINHNFSFVGSGKSKENDPTEISPSSVKVLQIDDGKVYYTSVDQTGSFDTGDFFAVDFNTGQTTIAGLDLNALEITSFTFQSGSNRTFVNASQIDTGNIRLETNTIRSLFGDINLSSASDQINVQKSSTVSDNLSLTGDLSINGQLILGNNVIDTLQVFGKINEDIIPTQNGVFDLGADQYNWLNVFTGKYINDDIEISGNTIKTLVSNSNLEIDASGTGKILINDSLLIDQDLLVTGGTTYTSNIDSSGTITLADINQIGSVIQIGNREISDQFTIFGNASLDGILISGNSITSTSTDLVLSAAGTGNITFNDSLTINQNLTLNGTLELENLDISNTVSIDEIITGDFKISDNYISINALDTNLQLLASGTGSIILDSTNITQDLLIGGTTNVGDVDVQNITLIGNLNQTGDYTQEGSFNIFGQFTNDNDLTVDNIFVHGNTIESLVNDLTLVANSSGNILINGDLLVSQNLYVDNFYNMELLVEGRLESDKFSTSHIDISDNFIKSTALNSDLQLQASGTGKIIFGNTEITNNLTVYSDTALHDTNIAGDVLHFGQYDLTGVKTQTGNFSLDGNLITGTSVDISNILIAGNSILSKAGDLILEANGTGKILVNDSLVITNDLYVDDINASTVEFTGILIADAFVLSDIYINDNYIQTTAVNTDLLLNASGTGRIVMDYFSIDNNFSNLGEAYYQNVSITGDLDQTGTTILTGDFLQTGNITFTNFLTINSDVRLEEILISGNVITTTTPDVDLKLQASGTGIIHLQETVQVDNSVSVSQNVESNSLIVEGTLATNELYVDEFSINDNYIEVSDTDLILRSHGSGSVSIESILIDATISTPINQNLIISPANSNSVVFDVTNSLTAPVGSTTNKNLNSTGVAGDFRFNTNDKFFEGFSTARRGFGGIFSSDRNTYVIAEQIRHSNDNILTFKVNNTLSMTISETSVGMTGLLVDNDIFINNNTISTTQSNSNLEIVTSNSVQLDSSLKLNENTISNTSSLPLTLVSSGNGYFNFTMPTAMVVPAGPESERPLSPEVGDIRWNTDLEYLEAFDGTQYNPAAGVGDIVTADYMDELISLYALILG